MKIVVSPVSGCTGVETPPRSHRSHVAIKGINPIAACSAAWIAPGSWRGVTAAFEITMPGIVEPQGSRLQVLRRERQRFLVHDLVRRHELAHEADHLVRHEHGAERDADVAERSALELLDDLDVGDVASLRVVVGVGGLDGGDLSLEVQLLDEELLAHVEVDGARMQGRERPMCVGGADDLAGVAVHDRVDASRAGPDVHLAVR